MQDIHVAKQRQQDKNDITIEAVLQQIAIEAEQIGSGDIKAVASEGISAFQHAYSLGKPLSSTAYAALLSILDSANAWELVPHIYKLYSAQVCPSQ